MILDVPVPLKEDTWFSLITYVLWDGAMDNLLSSDCRLDYKARECSENRLSFCSKCFKCASISHV